MDVPAGKCAKRKRWGLLLAAAAGVFPAVAKAQITYNWNVDDGNWSTAGNWNPSGVPGNIDTANIVNADDISRNINYDFSGPTTMLDTVNISNSGGGTNGLSMVTTGVTLATAIQSIGGFVASTAMASVS
jgi:hypothetical protein